MNEDRYQRQLRESEERHRLALAAANLGTWRASADGNSFHGDARFHEIFGREAAPSDMSLAEFLARVHEDDRESVRRGHDRGVAMSEAYDLTYRIRLADGGVRWVRDTARPLRAPDGAIEAWIGAVTDITAQKEFERSLQEAREQAEAAKRSRGEFLANMSHEIRTPMTSIFGYADLLATYLTDPDDLQCVATIRRNGQYLLEIINDILDLSKIDAGKLTIEPEPVRPDALLGDIRSLMDVRAKEKNVSLEISFASKIPARIHTDPVRLRQILLNLVGNAIKFTDEGTVQLVVRYQPEENGQLQFDVIDTGIGIEEEALPHLFEPFTQADTSATRSFGGTGLGLAISRRLARILGGDIAVRSRLNKGSVFSVTIDCGPVDDEDLVEPNLNAVSASGEAQRWVPVEGRILIVDDRRDIRFLAQHFIEQAGGNVATAANGNEALRMVAEAERRGKPIDLVLMDMQMPVMDGYEATAQLRARGFDRPIIALTAHAMKSDREKCLSAGCSDYTTKPLNGPHLVRLIAHHLSDQK